MICKRALDIRAAPGDTMWWTSLALSIAVWLAVLPYEHPYDDVMLLVPLFVILREATVLRGAALAATVTMLAMPELDLLGFRPNLTFSYTVVPVVLTAIASYEIWRRTPTPLLHGSALPASAPDAPPG
jgi:hypothetical protein